MKVLWGELTGVTIALDSGLYTLPVFPPALPRNFGLDVPVICNTMMADLTATLSEQ
jgi:hypothetical protein